MLRPICVGVLGAAVVCAVLALPQIADASPILEINGAGKIVGAGGRDADERFAVDGGISSSMTPTPGGLINQILLGTFDEPGLVFRFGGTTNPRSFSELIEPSRITPSSSSTFDDRPMIPNPEPASFLLLATGVAGIVAKVRNRRQPIS